MRNILHLSCVERLLYTVNHLYCIQFHNLDGGKSDCAIKMALDKKKSGK